VEETIAEVPAWRLTGDWFDLCRCRVPCGCTFAQPPDEGQCDGILAWHVREGNYGDVVLDGLNVVMVGSFQGNIWTGEATNSAAGFFMDERAHEQQREALQTIFGGQAGGWPAGFAQLMEEVRGIEFAPIDFEIADDLGHWRVEVPGKPGETPWRSPDQRRRKGHACSCTTRPGLKSAQARSLRGPLPRRTRSRHSASNGAGPVARASTSHLTGLDRTRLELRQAQGADSPRSTVPSWAGRGEHLCVPSWRRTASGPWTANAPSRPAAPG
jgi:hypothetical protein